MKKKILPFLLFVLTYSFSYGQWDSVGSGIFSPPEWNSGIYSLMPYNGDLFVGGGYMDAGGLPAMGISDWNGTTWSNFPSTSFSSLDVYALAVYKGNLYAGGILDSGIAMWNGTKWSSLGYVNGRVYALAAYNGNLYVGGEFDSAGGIAANNLAVWNGSAWSSIGNVNGGSQNFSGVYCFAIYNSNLCIGGHFDTVAGVQIKNIAEWDGVNWSNLGVTPNDSSFTALAVYNNELYAGPYNQLSGKPIKDTLTKWNGTSWVSLGAASNGKKSTGIFALYVYDSLLCIGGQYDSIGRIKASNVAYWNGSAFGTFGSGIISNIYGNQGAVNCFSEYNSTLYAGGFFDTAGGIVANSIAQWSGPLAVNNISSSNNKIKVFPNPSNGVFQLRIKNYELGGTVKIYNMLGQEVASSNSSKGGEFKSLPSGGIGWAIDISNQPSGIYLYRVTNSEGALVGSGKLVIN